jgi:uncharacterized membrane protein
MSHYSLKAHSRYLPWLRYFVILLLVLGIFFRFFNLSKKNYWNDEVYTSLRISGYTKKELINQVTNRPIPSLDWQKYQRYTPQKDWNDVLDSLIEDVHPPLYIPLVRVWTQIFGSSIGVIRSLSAVLSLLAFPCLYWLCLELFELPTVGWIAVALMAVSPFHVLYAQEARQYSMWTVTILLSCASFVRAIRQRHKLDWLIYTATVALGFYTHYFAVFVQLAHGVYIIAIEGIRRRKIFTAYFTACISGILLGLPWLLVAEKFGGGAYTSRKVPFFTIPQRWALNISSLFFDAQIDYQQPLFDVCFDDGFQIQCNELQLQWNNLSTYLVLLIVILVGYSLDFLYRKTSKQVWIFVFSLIGVELLFLLVPDLLFRGQRSTVGRYLIPCYIGIQIAIAYLLTVKITSTSIKRWQRRFWQLVMIVLVTLGILSNAISSQAETWWIKYSSYYEPQVAKIINQSVSPVVLVEDPIRLLTLSYLVSNQVNFQRIETEKIEIPSGFSDIFLFRPSNSLRQELESKQNYKIIPIYKQGHLWQLKKLRVGVEFRF